MLKNYKKGFTLIELLVVIGVLSVLLVITLVAINPSRQFSLANNTKRRSDVNSILNAIHQYAADNKGVLPTGITTIVQAVSSSAANVCASLVSNYLAALPADPLTNNGASVSDCAVAYTTGYTVVKSATNNRVTVAAPDAELSEAISVTR
ncbi:MAG: type II secretion system protein [Patescibacteria group bacterium]